MSDLPTADEVIEIHDEIEEQYDLKHTGAAVASPWLELREILEDIEEYDGTYLRAAGLLRHILTAHVFEDGNKRTAWTTTVLYLENHDAEPAVRERDEAEQVLKRIRRFDVDEIAKWLANGDLDRDRLGP
jgi:prophage maintenance system killer protein